MKQSTRTRKQEPPNKFCCTVPSCLSGDGLPKPFASKKLLTQHYIKVHAEKKFACCKCEKKFGAEWLQKHHESTCGMSWTCSCGTTYQNREALLTHARRHQHTLPFKLKRGDTSKPKPMSRQVVQPVIVPVPTPVIIILQNQSTEECHTSVALQSLNSAKKSTTHAWRNIVPKADNSSSAPQAQHALQAVPCREQEHHCPAKVHQGSQTNVSCRHKRTKDSSIQASWRNDGKKDASEHVDLPPKVPRRIRPARSAVQTQTCKTDVVSKELRPSTANQQSLNAARKARGRSTHTQTVESAVYKVKKKAKPKHITSEDASRTSDKEMTTSELWNDIDTLLFNTSSSPLREWTDYMPRITSATQTLERDRFLDDLCDSYVSLQSTMEREPTLRGKISEGDSGLQKESALFGNGLLAEKGSMLPVFSAVCDPVQSSTLEETLEQVSKILSSQTQTDDILDSFLMCSVQQSEAQTDFPLFSHNETQTNDDVLFECSSVFHMETQTSGFLFSDLESVDIETQTPWAMDFDFSIDNLVAEVLPHQVKRRDAESQIENCQLPAAWLGACSERKDCTNIETQTGAAP